jgi:RNA polymerase sigma factor (sigma-70 family)
MQLRTGGPLYDDAAFAELYQRHAHALLRFIWSHVRTREDAEDVLLEVFLAAMERDSLAHLNEGEQLAWLRRVAHNKCIDAYRRTQRRPAVPLDSALELLYADEEQAPEQLALRMEEHAHLRALLAQLPEQQQTVLRLHFADNLRGPEIARRLNKSEGSVRKLLSRALNHLREMYGEKREKGDRKA